MPGLQRWRRAELEIASARPLETWRCKTTIERHIGADQPLRWRVTVSDGYRLAVAIALTLAALVFVSVLVLALSMNWSEFGPGAVRSVKLLRGVAVAAVILSLLWVGISILRDGFPVY